MSPLSNTPNPIGLVPAISDAIANAIMSPDGIYTDVAEAKILTSNYSNRLRYCKATDWLVFDGTRWTADTTAARRIVHDLADQQEKLAASLELAAYRDIQRAQHDKDEAGEKAAKARNERAKHFRKSALGFQMSGKVNAVLKESAPYLSVRVEDLDSDPYLLNTPTGTVDLRTGEIRSHNPKDLVTKITGVAPSHQGEEEWLDFLGAVTCYDEELQEYLQIESGELLFGKVMTEHILIAIGSGGNGKSTFFNALFRVMGEYARMVPAGVLTSDTYVNKSFIYADLLGVRFVLAAELPPGQHLDSAAVKILGSADPIRGEHKFRDAFQFLPSHTSVLYTNNLPRVGASDNGTWDRLVVQYSRCASKKHGGDVTVGDLMPIKRQAGQSVEEMAEQMASAPDRQHWKSQPQSGAAISAIVSHGLDLMRGRPQRVNMNDFEAVRTGTEAYLSACAQASRMPSVAGLACALGYSRRQLYRFAERDDEVGNYLQRFQTVVSYVLEQAGLKNSANVILCLFLLKNQNQGYSDRSEVELIPSHVNPLDGMNLNNETDRYLGMLPESEGDADE